jgi:hypothetical protein
MSTWRASGSPGAATVEPGRDRKPGEHRMTVTVSVPVDVDPGALPDEDYERAQRTIAERVSAALNRGGML